MNNDYLPDDLGVLYLCIRISGRDRNTHAKKEALLMGQVPPKYFLPSSPYGSSPAANVLNPVQPAAQNPQTPMLPPTFSDPGPMQKAAAPTQATTPTTSKRPAWWDAWNALGLIVLCLFALPLYATSPVTGSIQNLGTGNVTNGAFVRFWLRGCGGNIPRVNGTSVIGPSQGGVYFFDFPANSSGVISGTLYSTRDTTGALGGDIECGGSKLSVWYGMQVFVGGKGGAEVPVHARNGVTLDITQVTPITSTPVVPAPTGDNTYLRLDAGNAPVTGNLGALVVNSLTDNGLTPGNCIQAAASGLLTTVSGPCGTSSGTLTATGIINVGSLAQFSGGTSLTSGNLSGDCLTPNSLVVTCTKTGGVPFASSATVDATNASNITSGTLPLPRLPMQGSDTKILSAGIVSGVSTLLCTDSNGGATTVLCPSIPTLPTILKGSGSLNFGSPVSQSSATATLTVTGANVGAAVFVSPTGDLGLGSACYTWSARVSSANTVTVIFGNCDNNQHTPAVLTWNAVVIQ